MNTTKTGIIKYITLSSNNSKYEFDFHPDKTVKINKRKENIKIETNDDGFTHINMDNKSYPVEIVEKNQNKYTVQINGVNYTFSVETPISYKRKKFLEQTEGETKSEQVLAPMPGKIIEINVEKGSAVKEGDSILTLEAMKMENQISAHISGTIKSIDVKPGDNVMKDAVLVEIEK